jgi:PmbA protein
MMNIVKYALKKGADDVIVEKIDKILKQIRFTNNSIVASKVWNLTFYKVFLTRNKRVVNTIIYDTSKKSIKDTIDKMVKTTKVIEPNKDFYGIAEGPFKYKKIPKLFDKKLIDVDAVDLVNSAINSALKYSKKTAGTLYIEFKKRKLETSSKISTSEKTSSITLSIRAFNEKDESGHAVSCSRVLSGFDPRGAGEKAGEISKLARKPKNGKKGKYDVIFDPLSIANLLSLIGDFSSIFAVESGLSFLKDKLGQKVGNDNVTIVDDGTIENGLYSSNFDCEGVPTKRKNIIEKGVLKTIYITHQQQGSTM